MCVHPHLYLAPQHPATRVQAEAALLEFRLNASVEACVGVLQASGDEGVRFQVLRMRGGLERML